jgi:origin recognition complex subunit 2
VVDEFDIDLEMPTTTTTTAMMKKRGGARASRLRFKQPLDFRPALNDQLPIANEAAKAALLQSYRDEANDWWYVLHAGFNLLFHGVGANEQFINDFVSRRVPPRAIMTVVMCEHPNTTVKQLLMTLAHVTPRGVAVLRGAQGIVPQARKLAAYMDELEARDAAGAVAQYLVLHAIDAPSISSPESQAALSVLSACRLIRVVATARHPRVALLWSHTVWRRMQWHNVHLSTLLPIRSEVVRLGRSKQRHNVSTRRSALLVLSSVSGKARQIFAAFVRVLLKHPDEGGIKLQTLYDACHAQFLVASMQELRQQLVEFRTHSLISASGSGFSEKLACPLGESELRLLLTDIDELQRSGVEAIDDDNDE